MNPGTIGNRAYSECIRIFGGVAEAAKALETSARTVIYRWNDTGCPHAYFLSKLYLAGADIKYILTGERENENQNIEN